MPVLGTFKLTRAMDWRWDPKFKAYIAKVRLQGMFSIVASVNITITNTTTSSSSTNSSAADPVSNATSSNATTITSSYNKTLTADLNPTVDGMLTLYSAVYPGPGFTGLYDWDGNLTLDPDPYRELKALMAAAEAEGADMTNNSSSSGGGHKRMLLEDGGAQESKGAADSGDLGGSFTTAAAADSPAGSSVEAFEFPGSSSSSSDSSQSQGAGGFLVGTLSSSSGGVEGGGGEGEPGCLDPSEQGSCTGLSCPHHSADESGGSRGSRGICEHAWDEYVKRHREPVPPCSTGSSTEQLCSSTASRHSDSSSSVTPGSVAAAAAAAHSGMAAAAIRSSSSSVIAGSSSSEVAAAAAADSGMAASASSTRVLLQTAAPPPPTKNSTAAIAPVQGRVTVREWQPAEPGSTEADPKVIHPDISVQGVQLGAPGSCPDDAPCLPWLSPDVYSPSRRKKRGVLGMSNMLKWVLIGVGSGIGFFLLLLCCFAVFWKRRKDEEEEEKKRKAITAAAAAEEAAAATTSETGAPMQYGKKLPTAAPVFKGKAPAPAASAPPAAGEVSGSRVGGAPAGPPATSSPVLPVSSSGGDSVLPVSTSGGGEMRMESMGGSFSGAFAVTGGAAEQLQQRQQRPRKSGLFGFFGKADLPAGLAGANQKGLLADHALLNRPPTLPGHHRGSEPGLHEPHTTARTRISLIAVGPTEAGEAAAARKDFAAALGLGGGRTQQMRQVPRAQGMTLDGWGEWGWFCSYGFSCC